jgi:hypothetical protein
MAQSTTHAPCHSQMSLEEEKIKAIVPKRRDTHSVSCSPISSLLLSAPGWPRHSPPYWGWIVDIVPPNQCVDKGHKIGKKEPKYELSRRRQYWCQICASDNLVKGGSQGTRIANFPSPLTKTIDVFPTLKCHGSGNRTRKEATRAKRDRRDRRPYLVQGRSESKTLMSNVKQVRYESAGSISILCIYRLAGEGFRL